MSIPHLTARNPKAETIHSRLLAHFINLPNNRTSYLLCGQNYKSNHCLLFTLHFVEQRNKYVKTLLPSLSSLFVSSEKQGSALQHICPGS